MQHFNRERIPERVVHAKGSGAYGTFRVTNDISKYSKASVFSKIGKETEVLLRFSTVAGERGAANAERDRLTTAIAGGLGQARKEVQKRQVGHFYKADPDYGRRVAKKLGFEAEEFETSGFVRQAVPAD